MKKLICILLIGCFFFTNCKHQISRIGYKVDYKSSSYANCNITIKKFEIVPDSVATKIGSIKLSDSGFSNSCSEAEAMVILKNEGCALKADFVNISKEKKADDESKCYRCRAEFYKYKK
jgi:hypothetical protein